MPRRVTRDDAFLRAAQRCALEARVEYSDFEKPAFDAAQALLSQGCTALLAGNSKLCLDLLSRAQRLIGKLKLKIETGLFGKVNRFQCLCRIMHAANRTQLSII